MRKKHSNGVVTVNAIAGTHVVTLGLDLESKRKGCLGFAIQREDHTEDERYWMTGMKTFEATDPGLGPGGQASSREHPFQAFQWADYTAKPDHDYTYTAIPLYGSPNDLKEGDAVAVRIQTETEFGKPHSVFFNRGAVASQEYVRRFQNKSPKQLPPSLQGAAYKWLSRGLLEAFKKFVGRADGKSYGLYGAVYEFQWPEALAAVKDAVDSGADVQIIYDAIPSDTGPVDRNEEAIANAKLKGVCFPRTNGKIMHNKFFVLTKDDKPVAVWTGSTNLTENGIFGHLNCGHAVEDPKVAQAFLDYWHELKSKKGGPDAASERLWMGDNNPAPPDPWESDTTTVFSPRTGLKVLRWYSEIADSAKKALFMTFAFGMHKYFKAVYDPVNFPLDDEEEDENDHTDDAQILRFALMEKEGNGAGLAQGRKDIAKIRKLPNVVVAIGKSISVNSFDRWLKERDKLTAEANVRYVHTKFALVDPLGKKPVVITGSANFSEASTNANNENMLVIRGDTRVADIYMGEFMRIFSHYTFRESVARWQAKHGAKENWEPNYLAPDDGWQHDHFNDGDQRCLRRVYFSGG